MWDYTPLHKQGYTPGHITVVSLRLPITDDEWVKCRCREIIAEREAQIQAWRIAIRNKKETTCKIENKVTSLAYVQE